MAEKVAEAVKKRGRPVRASDIEGADALTEEDCIALEKEHNV